MLHKRITLHKIIKHLQIHCDFKLIHISQAQVLVSTAPIFFYNVVCLCCIFKESTETSISVSIFLKIGILFISVEKVHC